MRKWCSLEVQVLESEVCLHNACGFNPGPQDILLSRDIGGLGYPVQIVQVTREREKQKEREIDKERDRDKETDRERQRQRRKWRDRQVEMFVSLTFPCTFTRTMEQLLIKCQLHLCVLIPYLELRTSHTVTLTVSLDCLLLLLNTLMVQPTSGCGRR